MICLTGIFPSNYTSPSLRRCSTRVLCQPSTLFLKSNAWDNNPTTMSNFRVGIFAQMRWPWVVAITTLFLICSIWFLDPISLVSVKNQSTRMLISNRPVAQHRNRLSTFHEPFEAEHTPKNNTLENLKDLSNRPLILYAYAETENARTNLKFFIAHALHANADFLFVFNGETNAMDLLPSSSNIRAIHRGNTCYDLGAFAEILVKDDMYKLYKRFILMNASIRGPFVPYWSNGCWSDMFLSKITDSVKVSNFSSVRMRSRTFMSAWA